MAEPAPLWWAVALPPALALAAGVTAALAGAGAGRRPAPLRELARRRRHTVAADAGLRTLGAVLLPVAAVAAAVVLPFGFRSVSDLAVGVVWFNAMGALAWAAVWLAGWGANSALSLIGGYRFLAQGLAYEVPHMLALTTAALGAGSLRVGAVVEAQRGLWFVVWMPVAFAVFLLSAVAMAFVGPFDQPVGRDVAGGAAGELGGVDRLLFLGGRWLLLVVAAGMAVPLFLGGGHGPWLPAWCWTLVKTAAVLGALLWLRRLLPAVRMDRFTTVAWTVVTPLAVVQALWVSFVVLGR
ncbi:NADH-quinone oxidoreductase subunit H [Streptomyces sp. NPDC127098]|uniref:NADH-quinone oxidoreductase subunit H n=1 Tax=Streptomyces sp. NPDC127098 TaxID=3347137 RepID=UPI0036496F15